MRYREDHLEDEANPHGDGGRRGGGAGGPRLERYRGKPHPHGSW